MDDFINIISNVGFPIAVSLYLLTRFEHRVDKLTRAVDELRNVIRELQAQLRK